MQTDIAKIQEELGEKGFSIVRGFLDPSKLKALSGLLEEGISVIAPGTAGSKIYAIRNVFGQFPELKPLVEKILFPLLSKLVGEEYKDIKNVYFNKPQRANWLVGWHQDIALKEGEDRGPAKNRIMTREFLEKVITFRIHIDDADETNGALRVIPGSHRNGIIQPEEMKKVTQENGDVICSAQAGDLILMKPLLLHASSKATVEKKRRVIHVEYISSL